MRATLLIRLSSDTTCFFQFPLQLGELHQEKVKGNYAVDMLGWLTGCSACWLCCLCGNLHILYLPKVESLYSKGFFFFWPGISIYFESGWRRLRYKNLLTGLALALLEMMMCEKKQPRSIFQFAKLFFFH